jgi:hypothetical protein
LKYQYLATRGAINEAGTGPADAPAGAGRAASWRDQRIPLEVLALLPESAVREYRVVPVAAAGESLTVATADPHNIALADRLSALTARRVRIVPASREEIDAFIDRHYGRRDSAPENVDSLMQEFDLDTAAHSLARGRAASASAPPGRSRGKQATARAGTWVQQPAPRAAPPRPDQTAGLDPTQPLGDPGVFTYVVEEGQRALMRRPNGTMDVVVGPRRVWRGRNTFQPMPHFVAHPGDYLIVRYRDGRQEHRPGPSEVWFDSRVHQEVTCEEALQIAAKEAVVVYSSKEGTSAVQRRIEFGPTLFMPRPGEWLHTFAWHSSDGGSQGARKQPRGLVFQKLWLMPDQMYHDVPDVRTADDAVLTIRLMIFFELTDIERMLEATHDPIGDFVNAATSDVVDFTGRHDFEAFKRNTDKLNELETYRQLTGRGAQCGYRINKVVYRGYGAPERLQQMHDQAIEARTRLQLDRATEQQAQDLEGFRLDSQLLRAGKRRVEQTSEVEHETELARLRQEAELRDREARSAFDRQQAALDAELRGRVQGDQESRQRGHLEALRSLGVDLTAYLTQSRADRVIELRGPRGATHLHLDPTRRSDVAPAPEQYGAIQTERAT